METLIRRCPVHQMADFRWVVGIFVGKTLFGKWWCQISVLSCVILGNPVESMVLIWSSCIFCYVSVPYILLHTGTLPDLLLYLCRRLFEIYGNFIIFPSDNKQATVLLERRSPKYRSFLIIRWRKTIRMSRGGSLRRGTKGWREGSRNEHIQRNYKGGRLPLSSQVLVAERKKESKHVANERKHKEFLQSFGIQDTTGVIFSSKVQTWTLNAAKISSFAGSNTSFWDTIQSPIHPLPVYGCGDFISNIWDPLDFWFCLIYLGVLRSNATFIMIDIWILEGIQTAVSSSSLNARHPKTRQWTQ